MQCSTSPFELPTGQTGSKPKIGGTKADQADFVHTTSQALVYLPINHNAIRTVTSCAYRPTAFFISRRQISVRPKKHQISPIQKPKNKSYSFSNRPMHPYRPNLQNPNEPSVSMRNIVSLYHHHHHHLSLSNNSANLQPHLRTQPPRMIPNIIPPIPNPHTHIRKRIDLQSSAKSISYQPGARCIPVNW